MERWRFDTSNELNEQEVRLLSPLGLAYIGDSIYELLVRKHVIATGNMPVQKLHKASVSYVCATAQAEAFDAIEHLLSEDEIAIYKRGRNANGNVPKNANVADYRKATGLEALFGYLYLLHKDERIKKLFEHICNAQAKERNESETTSKN